MIAIQELQQFIESVKNRVSEINFTRTLIDEADINKDLQERSALKDLHMLYAVIPEADVIGSEDTLQDKNYIGFMVLHKSNYSSTSSYDQWVQIFIDTQKTTEKLRDLILEDKAAGYSNCGFLRHAKTDTIHMAPVKWLSGCNGWMLTIDIVTDF